MEKFESIEEISEEKRELLNKIIAAGLNSLSHATNVTSPSPEKELLDTFVSQSFEEVLPCWQFLNLQIQFHVFKAHITEFEKYMRGEKRGDR